MKKLINLKNLINIRNLIIVVLCITIISLGIGFAILSVELEKRSSKNLIFNVAITDVKQNTSIKGGDISPTAIHTITDSKKTISTQMNLYVPYDELSYTYTSVDNTIHSLNEAIDELEILKGELKDVTREGK